jgi:2-phospho-L-lactate guanylyltransferase (CobY/MobA/RfbA family)
MIDTYYTTEFTNTRLEWYEEEAEYTEQVSFNGHIQQLNAEDAESLGMNWTISYRIWCDIDTDVIVGDVLDDGSNKYTVRSIKNLNLGRQPHLEVYVEK